MYDSFLVPTDGSEQAVLAAEQAVALAENPTVVALAVVDISADAGPFSAGGIDEEFRQRRLAAAEKRVRRLEQSIEVAVTGDTRVGSPAEEIRAAAADHDVDAMALGTRGRTGFARMMNGSVSEAVIRSANRPVLTAQSDIKRHLQKGCTDVLVPTDGSDVAEDATELAVSVADRLDARLHVVSVVDLGAMAARPGLTPSESEVEKIEADRERSIEPDSPDDVDTVTEILDGIPAQDILAYADRNDVDLIVMGTHGRTGLERFLRGSVTERVLRTATAPVLALPA